MSEVNYRRTLRMGNKTVDISTDPFKQKGRVEYTGFGVHGKVGSNKNRSNRRENRRDAREIERYYR